MVVAQINNDILQWAREINNLNIEEVARRMKKTESDIQEWESGESSPTYVQLEKLSGIYNKPIAVFFFPEEPDIESPQEKFRTLPEYEFDNMPHHLIKIIRDAQKMQINLEELFDGNNPSDNFLLNKIKKPDVRNLDKLAEVIRKILGISLSEQYQFGNNRKALKKWREAFEDAGIFVFKDAFKCDDVSAFCFYDKSFPLIYLNNSLPFTRQIFSLFHELGHLMFCYSGIDKNNDTFIRDLSTSHKKIEVFCNEFAGKFLLPDNQFKIELEKAEYNINDKFYSNLADKYSVSREVILRKTFDFGYINETEYNRKATKWTKEAKENRRGGQGGNYYYNQIAYLGESYINLVLSKYYQKQINSNQASDYLNVKVDKISDLETYLMS